MSKEQDVMKRTVAEAIRQAKLLFAPKRGNQSSSGNASPTQSGLVPPTPADATKFLNGASTPAFAQVKGSDLSMSDVTTNDVSTTKHGFCPKAPNDTTKFLRGDGAWGVPAGGGSSGNPLNTQYSLGQLILMYPRIGSNDNTLTTTGEVSATSLGTVGGSGGTNGIGQTNAGQSGQYGTNTGHRIDWNPLLKLAVNLAGTANLRMWIGFTDQAAATIVGTATPAGNLAAFRFDAAAGDTTWKCCTKDNATMTVVDSGVAPVTGTTIDFAIDCDSAGTVKFYINGALVGTITTHLPVAGTAMRWVQVGNISSGSYQIIYYGGSILLRKH